ncbi:MAG TPA: hypothetical protein VE111_14670 [Bradyrhizobium sp.]|nr:hypothetical protein [Bradyrhizobium sp.]
MIYNIIDRRTRQHRWRQITAIVEPTYHDNTVDDADQADNAGPDAPVHEQRPAISVTDAVAWATGIPCAVTLYFYDLGAGI